jgi:hypothetical protein
VVPASRWWPRSDRQVSLVGGNSHLALTRLAGTTRARGKDDGHGRIEVEGGGRDENKRNGTCALLKGASFDLKISKFHATREYLFVSVCYMNHD